MNEIKLTNQEQQVVDYLSDLLVEDQEEMRNPNKRKWNTDFHIAERKERIKQAQEGNFTERFDYRGTCNGKPEKGSTYSTLDLLESTSEYYKKIQSGSFSD